MTHEDDLREPLTSEQAASLAALTAEGYAAAEDAMRLCPRGECLGVCEGCDE